MNWNSSLIIILGAVILVIGWQGTHQKVWSVITGAPFGNFGPASKCPPGSYRSTTGVCPGQCTIDTIFGPKCVASL